MSNTSGRRGRSWYRLSGIVRPTPYSSRDPSPPRHVIEPPLSTAAPPLPPPQPPSQPFHPPPQEVQESKPSPVTSIKQDHETIHQTPSPVTSSRSIRQESPKHRLNHETTHQTPSPITSSRSIKQEPPKNRHEHETTHQTNILTSSSKKESIVHGPKKEQQQHESNDDDINVGTEGVITISCENKGAIMEILNKTHGAEEESKSKKHSDNSDYLPMDRFVNSNVQMINSSVVYNSTEAHRDPGVHLSMILNSGVGFIIKDNDHENGYNSSIN